jgi:hypothetical protein
MKKKRPSRAKSPYFHGNRKYHKDEIRKAALECESNREFKEKYGKMYRSALAFGKEFIDEIRSHMGIFRFSIPQLMCKKILEEIIGGECVYNDRTALNGLELDIYFPSYCFAVEYNGVVWHKMSKAAERDKRKRSLCEKLGIHLIVIEQERIEQEFYEEHVKRSIIENLDKINSLTGKDISPHCVEKVECQSVFEKVAEMSNRTSERLMVKINECDSLKEFSQKHPREYKYIGRNKKLFLLDDIRTATPPYTDEHLERIVSKFDSIKELLKQERTVYHLCAQRGLLKKFSKKLKRFGGLYKYYTDSQLNQYAKELMSRGGLTRRAQKELFDRGLLEAFQKDNGIKIKKGEGEPLTIYKTNQQINKN